MSFKIPSTAKILMLDSIVIFNNYFVHNQLYVWMSVKAESMNIDRFKSGEFFQPQAKKEFEGPGRSIDRSNHFKTESTTNKPIDVNVVHGLKIHGTG